MADDFGSSAQTAGSLPIGGLVTGTIETTGDTDWFAVTLSAGASYQFFLQGSQTVSGTHVGGTLPNPLLQLRDLQGAVLARSDDGYGFNSLLNFTAPASGVFYLEASSSPIGGVGTYSLSAKPFAQISDLAAYLTDGWFAYIASSGQGIATTPRHWASHTVSVNVTDLTPAEQGFALAALGFYHDVANINFVLTSGVADITYVNDGSKVEALNDWTATGGFLKSVTVDISSDVGPAIRFDSHVFQSYLHETGHALGLGHSGPYNGGAPVFDVDNLFANDTLQWTVMTYFGWPGQALHDHVITPQMADIFAIQSLYGANEGARLGNTIYGFNSTAGAAFDFANYATGVAFTIYDSGGQDTLDASGYLMDQAIDLRPGAFSSIGGFKDNIGVYLTTVMENAIGGGGGDKIIGNDAGNLLTGGPGNDAIDGGAGLDTAVFSGPSISYAWTRNPDNSWSVRDNRPGAPDGTDTLAGIERLRFSDVTVVLSVLPPYVETALLRILRADSQASANAALVADLSAGLASNLLTEGMAVGAIIAAARSTSSVATLAYQFFTGSTPSAAGMDYLVALTGPNPNNLNSAYYQSFSLENRYINFAVNLGKAGAGQALFQSNYGSLSLGDALSKAYATIFGSTPSAGKIDLLLNGMVPDGLGGTETRAQYFAFYGQDGLNGLGTKAAMVGWLLGEAVKADIGDYALSNDAFLTAIANGTTTYGVDLIGQFDKPSYHYISG